jgi:hypothetical protein
MSHTCHSRRSSLLVSALFKKTVLCTLEPVAAPLPKNTWPGFDVAGLAVVGPGAATVCAGALAVEHRYLMAL